MSLFGSCGTLSPDSDLKLTALKLQVKWNLSTLHGLSCNFASSTFRFLENDWHLRIQTQAGMSRELYLVSGKPNLGGYGVSSAEQFVVTVHVESDTTGQVLPALTSTTTSINNKVSEISIWKRSTTEMERASPEFKTSSRFRFILVFEATGNNSTSTLFSPAPSVQTSRNVLCLESLSEDFTKLLDEGSNPDIEFQCGGQSTKAHGAVVSARSQVIAKMLATDMVEGRTKVVKIPDLRPDIFEKFLRYIYTGKLDELTFEVALNMFEAGDQYAVTGLAKRCSEYLVEHLSVQNACEVLVIADAHSDEGLVKKVVDYMVDKRIPVASEAWPAFCDEHPRLAIKVLNRGWKAVVK